MKEKINLIFDCDGTLVNSYEAISDYVNRTLLNHNIDYGIDKIKELCIRTTVRDCIKTISDEYNLNYEELISEARRTDENLDIITLYDNVIKVLKNDKFNCFCYTHRGKTCAYVFNRLGLSNYFIEVVDSTYGFKRKPDSEGIDYLVNKYNLDLNNTYYVGDRSIDIECGINSNIKTIFFNSSKIDIDTSKADYVINDLIEINEIFK